MQRPRTTPHPTVSSSRTSELARATAVALLSLFAACTPEQPRAPLPPDAAPVRTPRDMEAAWLDNQEANVRAVLTPRFGALSSTAYRVDARWTWDALVRHFEASLVPPLARHGGLPAQGRHHRLQVWSRDGQDRAPMVGLALVEPPAAGASTPHLVVLVLTPRTD